MSIALRGAACSLLPILGRTYSAVAQPAAHQPSPKSMPNNNKPSEFHLHDLQKLNHAQLVQQQPLPLKAASCVVGAKRRDENIINNATDTYNTSTAFKTLNTHPEANMMSALSEMRSSFPPDFWQHIQRLFPDRYKQPQLPIVVDVAVGADGSSAVELAQKGFHVIGVETDANILAKTFAFAQSAHAEVELMTAKVEKALLQDESCDMVTFLHGLHMIDTEAALREAWRILKPNGTLVAAWNDRYVCLWVL